MTPILPSIACLQAFESVARHGSITRAAQELNLTQSAVSRQIHQLESLLDVRLFERVRQRVIITDAGKLYLNDVSRAMGGLLDIGWAEFTAECCREHRRPARAVLAGQSSNVCSCVTYLLRYWP